MQLVSQARDVDVHPKGARVNSENDHQINDANTEQAHTDP